MLLAIPRGSTHWEQTWQWTVFLERSPVADMVGGFRGLYGQSPAVEDGQWVPLGVEARPLGETRSWVGVLSGSGWLLLPLALTVAFQRTSAASLPQALGPGWVSYMFPVSPSLSFPAYITAWAHSLPDYPAESLRSSLPWLCAHRRPFVQALRWLLNSHEGRDKEHPSFLVYPLCP